MLGVIARDELSAPFFDAGGRGELLIRHCAGCGGFAEPAATSCPHCHRSDQLGWQAASRTGEVVSWVVVPNRSRAGQPAPPPTVVALVELPEGPWLTLRLPDTDPGSVALGAPVRIEFATPEGGEPVPYAVLAGLEPAL